MRCSENSNFTKANCTKKEGEEEREGGKGERREKGREGGKGWERDLAPLENNSWRRHWHIVKAYKALTVVYNQLRFAALRYHHV